MKEKLLHTPEGVRDIYNSECKRKSAVEKRIHHILELYGYQDIETPTFEFFDIFNSDTGTVSSVFFFSLRDGNPGTEVNPLTVDLAYMTVLEAGISSTGLNTSTGA